MIDWSLEKPAKRSLTGETNQKIKELGSIIQHQTDPEMDRPLNDLLGMLRGLVGEKKAYRQRRSVIGETRTEIGKAKEEIDHFLHKNYTSPGLREALEDLLGDLDEFAEIGRHRSRRSSDLWTCSDLAIIVREYDYVINLLETINNFIRENILNKFNDQMDDEVRQFVTQTLAVYTDAEAQLKTKRGPFVQYQTELGCTSTSSTTSITSETSYLSTPGF